MRIFPIIKKIITFVTGGAGIAFSMGADTQTLSSLAMAQTRDMGAQTESMVHDVAPTLAIGTQSESMVLASAAATATYPQGSDTQSMGRLDMTQARDMGADAQDDEFRDSSYVTPIGVQTESQVFQESTYTTPLGVQTESMALAVEQSRGTGSESAAMVVDVVANLSQYTTAATAVTPDTPAWTTPTNAQGAINGTEAAVVSPGVADTTHDATLRCAGLVAPATPSGFTKTAVKIRAVDRWDLTITGAVAGVLDVTMQITLRDSADVAIATLKTMLASAGSTQATLLTEDFDITALVSDAQLAAGVKVDFRVFTTGVFVSTVNGNYSWQVDACHLVLSYSRTGIV